MKLTRIATRCWLVLGAAGVLVAAAVSSRALAGDWEPPFPLSDSADSSTYSTDADLRVDPDGSVLVAWSEGTIIRFRRFSRTFEPLIDTASLAVGLNPLCCQDSNGNVHFLFRDVTGGTAYLLADRDGAVLRPKLPLSTPGSSFRSLADLAFGDDGYVHMTYCQSFYSDTLLYCRMDLSGNVSGFAYVPLPAGPHTIQSPRVVPLGDGTVRLFYLDFLDNPTYFSRVYMLRLAASGDVIEGPTCVSHTGARTCVELAVAKDPSGDVHLVFYENGRDVPLENRVCRIHYRRLGPDGLPRTPIVALTEEPRFPAHRNLQLALDERGRLHLFASLERREIFRTQFDTGIPERAIVDYLLDTESPAIADMRIVATTPSWTGPVFRADGRGGWAGVWGIGYDLWMSRTNRASECRNGAVGGATAFDRRTLSIAGSGGDASHVLRVPGGVDLPLAIEGDAITPTTRFYVQARAGAAGPASPRWFPGVGLACFDFLDHTSAAAIWNGLGGAYGILGRSRVRGTPIPDPVPHPGVFFVIPGAATSGLPPGTRVAFQGFQTDSDAESGVSVTNAIVLEIQ